MKNAFLDFYHSNDLFNLLDFNFGTFPIFKTSKLFTNINSPKVNIKETDEAYIIEIANPGITKDQTEVKVEDNVIYVSMTSEDKQGEGTEKYHCKQWSKSSYQESWNLPENVNQEKISAKNVDGVLVITLPKIEIKQKKDVKKIDIK